MGVLRMGTGMWLLEVLTAFAILLVEGIIGLIWVVFPIERLQEYIVNKLRIREYKDPDWDAHFVELVTRRGYVAQQHYAKTADGYLLGLHRMPPRHLWTQGANATRPPTSPNKVVFFQHGFLQDSEAWVVKPIESALPYILVDMGYDVWLGNNRGNKYSHKHTTLSPQSNKFWDFCIDHFALGDIPAMIEYVLKTSGAKDLTYVGFSQGTAQAFAAFSSQKELAEKINLFVALGPATTVNRLKNPVAAALTTSRPNLVFLLLGKKSLLKQTYFWRKVLTKSLFVWVIDWSVYLLFGWDTAKISQAEKPLLYSHIYSFSSVKTVVHWFQITNTGCFQMFDDNIVPNDVRQHKTYMLPPYPVSEITCPIALFYGGRDTLPDNTWLLKNVPPGTAVHKVEDYEHLDFMWAHDVREKVFDKILPLLEKHNPIVREPTSST